MKPALTLLAALLLAPLAASHAAEIDLKDFGAAGDGTADDTAALEKAVAALAVAPKPAVLRFEAGRTYRIATGAGYAIRVQNQERIRIEGGGATLLLGADRRGIALHGCRDVAVCGLQLDYDPLPFAEALVTGVDRASRAIVARIGDDFAVPPLGGPTKAGGEQAYFAMLWNPGPHALRSTHCWVADLKSVPNEPHSVSVVADENFNAWNVIQPGTTRMTVPVRGIAHRRGAGAVIELDGNRDVLFEDVEIWSAPWFAIVVQRNEGAVTLRRVHVRPRPGTARITSSWRDGVHVKGNRASLLFEDCVLDGMNDDAFNIATFLSRVASVEGPQVRVRQNFPLGYVPWRVGDTLAAYATNTGTLLERARVLAVEEEPGANPDHAPHVTLALDRAVPRLAQGDQVWAVEAANPDTTLRRCTIRMSCRFQSRVTLEHCDVIALLWFYGEHIEGPLPSGSVVRHSRLRLGRGNPELAVACHGRINGLTVPAAATGMPPLVDLRFEDNEIDGRFDLRHVRNVQLSNNRFAPERGRLTIGDSREVLLKGNRLGEEALPATRIQIEDQATRDSLTEQ
jgi:hypothetical protein